MRNFDEWLSKFRPSISSYDYYIDFEKVVRNIEAIKVELNILNSLGQKVLKMTLKGLCLSILRHYNVFHCFSL